MTDTNATERADMLANAIAAKLLGAVNAPEQEIYRISREIAALAPQAAQPAEADGVERVSRQLNQHSTALVNLSAYVVEVRQAAQMAYDLLGTVKQTTNNVWYVDAFDPETAVCDTYSALEKALAATPKALRLMREALGLVRL